MLLPYLGSRLRGDDMPLPLTVGAIVGCPLPLHHAADLRAAAPAILAFAAVYPGADLEIAGGGVAADEVPERRPARPDRRAQAVLDRAYEARAALPRQPARARARMDRGEVQALRGVDIADADDAPAVHQELLDRGAVRASERVQPVGVEGARQRLDAHVTEKRMLRGRLRGPEHRAEAARVAQAQDPRRLARGAATAVADNQVEMVVFSGNRARGDEAQASRHAQVQDQVAVAAIEQQALAAPYDRAHFASGEGA